MNTWHVTAPEAASDAAPEAPSGRKRAARGAAAKGGKGGKGGKGVASAPASRSVSDLVFNWGSLEGVKDDPAFRDAQLQAVPAPLTAAPPPERPRGSAEAGPSEIVWADPESPSPRAAERCADVERGDRRQGMDRSRRSCLGVACRPTMGMCMVTLELFAGLRALARGVVLADGAGAPRARAAAPPLGGAARGRMGRVWALLWFHSLEPF
jgi:hypothetical protein